MKTHSTQGTERSDTLDLQIQTTVYHNFQTY